MKVITLKQFNCAWPTIISLLLVLFSLATFSLMPIYHTELPIVLIVIFCFAVFNPTLLNGICVFFIGLFADLLMAGPFGLQAFIYVLLFFIANLNRRFLLILSFKYLWLAFAFILAVIYLIWYLMFSLVIFNFLSAQPFILQYLVLVLIYPAVSWCCGWLNSKVGVYQ